MPDEHSNLNLPAAARRPAARRRGRRGGRGRARTPRPATENAAAPGENPPAGFDAPEKEMAEPVENFPDAPKVADRARSDFGKNSPPPERPRRPEPLRPKQFIKPASFRLAETSAISDAVAHANQIIESMRQMNERLEEILELVEVAERQKIADERELDELRRALRRIQPREPRREEFQGSRREQSPRRPREPVSSAEESAAPEPEAPPENPDVDE